jgi:hypothetical protein
MCKRRRGVVSPPAKPKVAMSAAKAPLADKSAQVSAQPSAQATRRGSLAAGGGGGKDVREEECAAAAVGGGGSAAAAAAPVAPVEPVKPVAREAPVEHVAPEEDRVEVKFTVSKSQFLAAYGSGGSHSPHLAWRLFKQQDLNAKPLVDALLEDAVLRTCPGDWNLEECYRCGLASMSDEEAWQPYELTPCDTCPCLFAVGEPLLYCDG